jgi:hypothetical protein
MKSRPLVKRNSCPKWRNQFGSIYYIEDNKVFVKLTDGTIITSIYSPYDFLASVKANTWNLWQKL